MFGEFMDLAKKFAVEASAAGKRFIKTPSPFETALDEVLHNASTSYGCGRNVFADVARFISMDQLNLMKCREDLQHVFNDTDNPSIQKLRACNLVEYILAYCEPHVIGEIRVLSYSMKEAQHKAL